MEHVNPKTGMTHAEARAFICSHFEEFVNRKNIEIGNVNFAPDFVDHGADVPPGCRQDQQERFKNVAGALKKLPDLHVRIEDMIVADPSSGKKLEFRGIVIWRIASKQIHERWAYLESPHEA
jgi:hypothetical protein